MFLELGGGGHQCSALSFNGPDMVVPVWNFQSRDTKLEKQNAKKLSKNFDTFLNRSSKSIQSMEQFSKTKNTAD